MTSFGLTVAASDVRTLDRYGSVEGSFPCCSCASPVAGHINGSSESFECCVCVLVVDVVSLLQMTLYRFLSRSSSYFQDLRENIMRFGLTLIFCTNRYKIVVSISIFDVGKSTPIRYLFTDNLWEPYMIGTRRF